MVIRNYYLVCVATNRSDFIAHFGGLRIFCQTRRAFPLIEGNKAHAVTHKKRRSKGTPDLLILTGPSPFLSVFYSRRALWKISQSNESPRRHAVSQSNKPQKLLHIDGALSFASYYCLLLQKQLSSEIPLCRLPRSKADN